MTSPLTTNARSERGTVTLMFAVLAIVFVSMAFMVVEGGRKLGNISRATDLASEAARAGAASLDKQSLAAGQPRIEFIIACEEIGLLLASAGDSRVTWDANFIDPRTIRVDVTITESSWIAGFDLTGRGRHQASVIDPYQPLQPVPDSSFNCGALS